MCRFIETIRVEDGNIMSLPYHQARVDRTLSLTGRDDVSLSLAEQLSEILVGQSNGIYKARIIYDNGGNVLERSVLPYKMRHIQSLRLVVCDDIEYSQKYEDRSQLSRLSSKSDGADEIIIVKNGLLTDTTFSNIALFDGKEWFTPRLPLLKGTMRQLLIDENVIHEADISPKELNHFRKISLINAMMPLGKCCVSISRGLKF